MMVIVFGDKRRVEKEEQSLAVSRRSVIVRRGRKSKEEGE
jgi:hypothetical protein